MSRLTVGKIRGLQEISTPEGLVSVLAMDHRGTLIKLLGLEEGSADLYARLRDFKLMVIKHLLPHSSAVLFDPQTGLAEAMAKGAIPGFKGLVVTLEESGYFGVSTARLNRAMEGWTPNKIKRMGASAIKLRVDYHPFAGTVTDQQEEWIARLGAEAVVADIPFLVEPVSYSTEADMKKESPEFASLRPGIVVATVERLGRLGVDILKIEFPHDAKFNDSEEAWRDACRAIDRASPVPWVLLSGGVEFDTFKRELRVACESGASGYVGGRAIWQEAASLPGTAQDEFLGTTAAHRAAELAAVARAYGHPWWSKFPPLAEGVGQRWMDTYN